MDQMPIIILIEKFNRNLDLGEEHKAHPVSPASRVGPSG